MISELSPAELSKKNVALGTFFVEDSSMKNQRERLVIGHSAIFRRQGSCSNETHLTI